MGPVRTAAAVAAVALSTVCCSPATEPSPPGRTALIQGARLVVRAGSAGSVVIDRSPAGRVEVTAVWDGPFGAIQVYVTDLSCPVFEDVAANRCRLLAADEGAARPKVVEFSSEDGGAYVVWAANRGPVAEAVTLDVYVTAASAGSRIIAGPRGAGPW